MEENGRVAAEGSAERREGGQKIVVTDAEFQLLMAADDRPEATVGSRPNCPRFLASYFPNTLYRLQASICTWKV